MSNGIVSSITRAGTTEPFDIQVVRNQVDGHSNVNINGYNAAVAGTAIPLWENATAYTFPASAVTMTVASSSATDTSPAKVTISGLDTNWNPISEQVTLNGTTGVTTVNQYLRINSVVMNTPATGQTSNVGTITVKNGSTTYGQINPNLGRSQMTVYSVPNGFNFHLRRINAWSGTSLSSSVSIFYNLVTQTYGAASLTAAQISFILFVDVHRYCPNVFSPKTDIQFQFLTSDSSSQHVSLYAEGLLVPVDVLTTQPGG
jgi:hypothetical protein